VIEMITLLDAIALAVKTVAGVCGGRAAGRQQLCERPALVARGTLST
jgi:hypothetical protein